MPKKIALIIGISYSKTKHALPGSINDAFLTKDLLDINGFETTMMLDSDPRYIQPTRQNILAQLASLIARAQAGDIVYLHFSGHGIQTIEMKHGQPRIRDCIYPASDNPANDLIKNYELREIITKLHPQAKLFALMDCCHSGSILKLQHNLDPQRSTSLHGLLTMISGCQKRETSLERNIGGKSYGALTFALHQWIQNDLNKLFSIMFSGDEYKLRLLQAELKQLLRGFPQTPNIAHESASDCINLATTPDGSPLMTSSELPQLNLTSANSGLTQVAIAAQPTVFSNQAKPVTPQQPILYGHSVQQAPPIYYTPMYGSRPPMAQVRPPQLVAPVTVTYHYPVTQPMYSGHSGYVAGPVIPGSRPLLFMNRPTYAYNPFISRELDVDTRRASAKGYDA